MNIRVVVIAGLPVLEAAPGTPCDAAVLKADYRGCTNKATKVRGRWALCAPHGRLDELEVVDKNA